MAIKEPVGTMICPECGLDGAHVKQAKSGLLYRWCPDCNAQYFPRTPEASDRLKAKMHPLPGTETAPEATPAPAPLPLPGNYEKKPASRGFDMGL